ncbi:carbonic anhydrase [Trametes versicolor FP-101664 SS1]|uniref:carbonic anhydrase n=1 Tax=Trametes versicolor (strain FP-101664) TaxID=717944 RepID=UPI00046231A1|nr:carbonic anhydrase [Trametes versicolor FP-101664 SS1]EIW56301.1 carbonic anhydrase [Trametes versicolor FP-101664 SS1]
MPQDYVLARLLHNNAQWAEAVERADPGFFARSAEGQSPKVLYFGCSDSRVPESVATRSMPGDIFVHRNIANQCPLDDDNALSVLIYAVATVKVSHIIVTGHTHCGGAKAALEAAHATCPPCEPPSDPLGRWLAPLTEIARGYEDLQELIEANVRAQIENIVQTDVVKAAWAEGRDVQVHGWMYELETGRMRDLCISVGKEGVL